MTPIVDGFTYSASLLYLPTSFRPSALQQMEVLRRATSYRPRQFCIPETLETPIEAFGQLEYQVRTQPGAYLWGMMFSAPFNETDDELTATYIHVQITDACTETKLMSDYALGSHFTPATGPSFRNPFLFPQPLLIGEPGLLDVELYNRATVAINCQLVLFIAEPTAPSRNMRDQLKRMGVAKELLV